jgi:3'-5' exonuclease
MSINMHKTMFIDIETVSQTKGLNELNEKMQALWVKKAAVLKPELSAADAFDKMAAIYSEFGKIIVVCMGYFKDQSLQQFRVKKFMGHNEAEVLQQVFNVFDKFFLDHTFSLCGHNIKEFDVPYLCRRALVNKVPLPFFFKDLQNRKPWENPLIDTLHQWRFGDFKHYISLELLATVLGIDTPKDDIDGSMVSDVYWQQNDLERIAIYCGKDVLTTAQIQLQLNSLPLLTNEQVSFV